MLQIENVDVCLSFLAARGVNVQGLSAEGKKKHNCHKWPLCLKRLFITLEMSNESTWALNIEKEISQVSKIIET